MLCKKAVLKKKTAISCKQKIHEIFKHHNIHSLKKVIKKKRNFTKLC